MPLDSDNGSIEPGVFYKSSQSLHKYQNVPLSKPGFDFEFPRRLLSILEGPCLAWKVFHRQIDALKFSKDKGSGLMTFAFQESDGNRLFLSAHPVVFWFHDNHKEAVDRRTYEVITEGAVCKLYFDLEFDKEFNESREGVRMTNTFINVVSHFMKEEFGILCDRKNILDLDSTSATKFSRHLIYNLSGAMFRDNYNVGGFVKMVCERLRLLLLSEDVMQEFCANNNLKLEDVKELFIKDRKGNDKLFCDEGVYTKNRHFRLYKSTKLKKNSPLLLSEENEFHTNSEDAAIPEKQLFLASLITYAPDIIGKPIKLLEFGNCEKRQYVVKNISSLPDCPVVSEAQKSSPVPVIDRFIQRIIMPGKIRCSTYFSNAKRVVYEISGNRFCHNVKRAHKSNNVYYIVDLENGLFYQKCHDSDCSGYRSQDFKLPPEIVFFLENEGDACLSNSNLSDSELQQVWEAVQAMSEETIETSRKCVDSKLSGPVPDYGLSDSDLLNVTNSTLSEPTCIPDLGLSDCDMLNVSAEKEHV